MSAELTKRLDRAQRLVTKGVIADAERKAVMMELWEGGMTQRELSERMSKAAVAAGGSPLSENAVHKLINHAKTNGDHP